MSSYLNNAFATIYVSKGILYVICKPTEMVTLSMAKSMIKARLELQNGVPFPIFCDTRFMQNSDNAAREYFAHEGMILAKAVALLVNHQATEALMKYFLRINKPVVPTKIYENETEAVEFLKTYIP